MGPTPSRLCTNLELGLPRGGRSVLHAADRYPGRNLLAHESTDLVPKRARLDACLISGLEDLSTGDPSASVRTDPQRPTQRVAHRILVRRQHCSGDRRQGADRREHTAVLLC